MHAKEELLNRAGFHYNFDRMAYLNRDAKKIFSWEAIEDHTEDWILERINERNDSGTWKFYTSGTISENLKASMAAELENERLAHR